MSRRERKTERQNCQAETMEEARKLIEKGKSKRSVAAALGMAESTLRKRLKRLEPATKLGRYETTFTERMEKDFSEHLKLLDDMYFGMTAKTLRGLAFEFATVNKIPHRFNKETKLAGKDWLRGYLRRNPNISLRQPTSTSVARAMGFNRPQVERFYINLSALLDKYNFPPHRVFNMDETGITTVPNKPPKVLSTKGKRSVSKISSAERGVNITVVNAMSASGIYVPPAFIFGRKRMKAELLDDAPAGSIGMISDSSYINSDLFINWLTHFKDHVKPTKESPALLILDNHVSHCTISAINFYRDNHIIALTLPPHTSHKMQPLDCGFHTVLKKYYANECEKWLRNHSGRAITVFQMVAIFTPAYLKTATLACAAQSFKVTGIVPYNPDVFTELDYLASSVTDRDPEDVNATDTTQRASRASTESESASQLPLSASVNKDPSHDEQRLAEDVTVASVENNFTAPESSTQNLSSATENPFAYATSSPTPGTSTEDSVFKTVKDICPVPKAQARKISNRKHKKSDIISSSPYKIEVEMQINMKKKPAFKIDPKGPQKSNPSKRQNARKIDQEPKKPKNAPKKKNWRCVGCQEIYKEPIIEDWIECSDCKEWWHENCTAYLGQGPFKCDLCAHN